MNPAQYKRRVLVCVTGLSPQVVTETLYALAVQESRWIPTEVHVLTTSEGARRASLMLLAPDRDEFRKLLRDQDLDAIRFDAKSIHVVRDAQGRPLKDIRTQSDNMAVADDILKQIAEFAADPDCAIHVSLAGGRKSMGFFAGYALSLCGREQDRLSHVLVSEGFESHPEFFFPPRRSRVLIGRNNDPISTADAVVELADIPFVRLRDNAPVELAQRGNFREVVEAAQRVAAPPRLRVIVRDRAIECAGERIPLSSMGFAIYAWHAWRLLNREEPAVPLSSIDAIGSPERKELQMYGSRLFDNSFSRAAEEWEARPWDDDGDTDRPDLHSSWLAQQRSRAINDRIRDALGEAGVQKYGIQSISLTGRTTAHGLDLPRECVEFVESDHA